MLDPVKSVITSYGGWISLLFFITALIYWLGVSEFALISQVPLPGPKPWPYFGNLLEIARFGGLHRAFVEYGKKYGKVYKMYMGRSPIITVANTEIMKHILVKDFDKFQNRPDVMRGNAPLDKGLFDARDEAWRKVRSILTPTFSALKLKELVPLIDDAVDVLLEKLATFVAKNGKFAKKQETGVNSISGKLRGTCMKQLSKVPHEYLDILWTNKNNN